MSTVNTCNVNHPTRSISQRTHEDIDGENDYVREDLKLEISLSTCTFL